MENNQQAKDNTVLNEGEKKAFRNEQPGQQMPADFRTDKSTEEQASLGEADEHHSDSSQPEGSNETLGTP